MFISCKKNRYLKVINIMTFDVKFYKLDMNEYPAMVFMQNIIP